MPYIGNQPGTGVRSRFIYTATASQTTFTGADDNSKTLKYADSAYVDVFLNGVCLVPGTDYTASTKTSVVLTQAASLSDTLEVIAYDIASMDDSIAKSGGTFTGDVTFADGADIITATAGTDNVRLGENAGDSITSGGNNNVAIGKDAGTAITTGANNTAVGFEALKTEDGNGNTTAIGYRSLKTQNAGAEAYNVAVGIDAGTGLTTGVSNTLIGGFSGGGATFTGASNTAVGRNSLYVNTSGANNVAIGAEALDANTTADQNTAVGTGAAGALTTGGGNTAVGRLAMGTGVVTGAHNTAVGYLAGDALTSGTSNTFVGTVAGDATTSGADNTAVGRGSLGANTTASNNTAVGRDAMLANTTGDAGVAVGKSTLTANTTGRFNTGCGYEALYSNTTGGYNTAVGRFALGGNTTGGYNVAVGEGALDANTTASNNIAMGSSALGANTTGHSNIAIGSSAGSAHTTADGGTYIGHVAGFNSNAQNTCIGFASAYSGNGSTSLTTGGGNTLIGAYTGVAAATNTGTVILGHNATGKGSNTGFINPTSGVYQGNNQSVWAQTSDRRLKKNITDSSIGLAEINQLKVRNFEYKTKDDLSEIESDGLVEADIIDNSGVQVGAIAQEIQAVLPKCVTEQDTGVLSLNTDNLTWHLIKAVQELSAKNDALEARIVTLEG